MSIEGTFDTVIVGAGSSGCVLAYRLSMDPAHRVLLVEAGPADRSPLIRMPKGFGALMGDPKHAWLYDVEPHTGNGHRRERWVRGKVLGGSSSINGMMYCRGQPEDYEHWERDLGLGGWGWARMRDAFRSIEDHQLGDDGERGVGGPLKVSRHGEAHPVCDAILGAAGALGIPVREDVNRPDQEGIGYACHNISRGRRQSAALAFLHPVMTRPNLSVLTGTLVQRVLFDGEGSGAQAVGVECRGPDGLMRTLRCRGEVILSAGAIESPCILQRSGIGPAERLQALGIPVRVHAPGVGENLREQWLMYVNVRLRQALSHNGQFGGWRLLRNLLQYTLTHKGLLASGAQEINGYLKTDPSLDRPDIQVHAAPMALTMTGDYSAPAFEPFPAASMLYYPMRPTSQGRVALRSATLDDAPVIFPNYLATPEDCRTSVAGARLVRRLFTQAPLRAYVEAETFPGAACESDDALLEAFRRYGQTTYHAVGTCKMGTAGDPMAVVDARLRVRGVRGLRVIDISVFPSCVSANTNGPAMAAAWNAASLVLADRRTGAAPASQLRAA
jgi:choline dehydrogenase-like flavoprotein